jgi:hypothetical protein
MAVGTVARALKSRKKPEEFLAVLRIGQLFKNPALNSANLGQARKCGRQ